MFLVGDAPPHMDYAQDTKYPVTLSVAKQKDIIVNTVLAGNAQDTERVWRDIAQNGNGRFIPIPQDGGQIVVIETPFDQDIIILQREINGTVIPYGPRALQKRTEDKTMQLSKVAAAAPSQASDMASFINKRARSTSEAVPGGGDLVSDIAAGRQQRGTLKDDELPDNLRALKPEARMDEVNKQMNAAQGAERQACAGSDARQIRRRPARQGVPEGIVVRSRRRGYAEGANQAVSVSRIQSSSSPRKRGRH